MSKRDVLDREMARRFAWRTSEPEALPAPAETPAPAPPPDPEARRQHAEYAEQRCRELAERIAQVWDMTSPPQQADATRKLVRMATRLGFDILRMDDHPLEAVRLWRLVVRHRAQLRRGTSALFGLGFMPVSPCIREVVDLLVEAAETGDSGLEFLLDRQAASEEVGRRHPELGARLARVVDTARTWKARVIAARWLSLDEFPDAIPALRRALRMRHARLRHCAIFILSQMQGPALRAEDVMWLLEDAVIHPLPGGVGRIGAVIDYEGALIDAVKKEPPAEGWRPLETIARGGGAHIRRDREGLGSGWALRALAAGYPERALARIDRELASRDGWRRNDLVEAIGLLADELARPRLLAAAAFVDHRVAEKANEIWFARFGGKCPVDPLAGVPVELLSEAPSERLLSRLTVLRGASDEARNTMIDALLAEAPEREAPPESLSADQREALALLLFLLRHAGWRHTRPASKRLSEGEWVSQLLRRFGAPAFDGLATIAEPAAVAGVPYGWLSALVGAAREGKLSEPQKDRLRAIGCAALASPAWNGTAAPLDALAVVGAPAALLERLWAIVTATPGDGEEPDRRDFDTKRSAVEALATLRDAPELDARTAAAAEQARAGRRWDLFERLVDLGSKRGAAAVLDVAERAVAGYDGDPRAFGPLYRAVWALEKAGRIDGEWLLERARRPESPVFAIAARHACKRSPEAVHAALRDALDSPARGGAAAAEAAARLVALDALAVEDERLAGIVERAPEPGRTDLVAMLIDCGAPLSTWREHVSAILLRPGDDESSEVLEALWSKQPEGTYELFEELLPRVTAENVRGLMEHHLSAPSAAELYWADRNVDEDHDDEDSFDEDEDDEDDPLD